LEKKKGCMKKYNQNDVYDNNRYLVRADGTIRTTNDWTHNKDTKNHIYAPDLKTARAKAKKLNLTTDYAALKKEIKKDAAKFLKSKDGKNYLKLKNKEVA